jgi:hypothetical protein
MKILSLVLFAFLALTSSCGSDQLQPPYPNISSFRISHGVEFLSQVDAQPIVIASFINGHAFGF